MDSARIRAGAGVAAPVRIFGFVRSRLGALACIMVAALLTLPYAEYPIVAGGEYEYQSALTVAFREHLHWGSQVIWTYGPLGYVNVLTFIDYNTWLLALAANLAAHLVFFGVLTVFLIGIQARTWQWLLMALIVVVFFERYQNQGIGFDFERFPVVDHKAALTAVMLLYLAVESQTSRLASVLAAAAGLLVAYLLLDKGTFMLTATGLIAAFIVLSLIRRRMVPVVALLSSALVGFVGAWLWISQPLSGIPAYFVSSYQLIAGYVGAMSWFDEAPDQHPMLQLGFGLAVLAVGAICLAIAAWKNQRPLTGLLLLATPVALFGFKNSFVRFDEVHALTFWSLTSLLLGLVLVRATGLASRSARSIAVLTALAVVANALLVLGLGVAVGKSPDLRPTFAFTTNLSSYRHAAALIARPSRRAEEEETVRRTLQAAYPLPADVIDKLRQGTVDVVPWDIQLAFAYGLDWDPQPILQSYAAYRPYLDQVNADHYRGPTAPRFVVFAPHDLDGRYPLFDEPLAYRTLLQRYQLREVLPNMIVLERISDPPRTREQGIGNLEGRLGEWIEVPDHGDQRLFARVNVSYSVLGPALALVDRPPELHIRFRYGGGQLSPAYRFVPAVAPDGLDLSAFAPDTAGIAQLAARQFDQPIQAFQIVANPPAQAYQEKFSVSFFTETTA